MPAWTRLAVLLVMLGPALTLACRADPVLHGDDTVEERAGTPGCWYLDAAPGWAIGASGDVLCMQEKRFVLLLADGRWDGWPIRWETVAGARRAIVTGTPAVDRFDVHWDVRADPAGGLGLELSGGRRVHLSPLATEARSRARSRLGEIADVAADCKRVRACWDHAPAAAKDLVDPEALYSAQACAMAVTNFCPGRGR
jgi:hypothetical protein